MQLPSPILSLLRSRKFLISIAALFQSILFALIPNFPDAVWIALDGVFSVLIAAIAYEDGQQKRAGQRQHTP